MRREYTISYTTNKEENLQYLKQQIRREYTRSIQQLRVRIYNILYNK